MKVLVIEVALALALSTSAFAQSQTPTPNTRNFTQPIKGPDGKSFKDQDGTVITLGAKAAECMYLDPKAKPEDKAKEFALANKIIDNAAWTFDAAGAVMIEKCVDNNALPIVAGQIDHMLEPDKFPEN